MAGELARDAVAASPLDLPAWRRHRHVQSRLRTAAVPSRWCGARMGR